MREREKIKIALVGGGRIDLINLSAGMPFIVVKIGENKTEIANIEIEALLARTPDILEKVKTILNMDGKIKTFLDEEIYVTEISMRVDVTPTRLITESVFATGKPEIWEDKRGCIFITEKVFFHRGNATVQTRNISQPEKIISPYFQKIKKVGYSKKSFRTALQKALEAEEEVLE